MYSFQAFRFYSLALNCLLYSLITFLRRKKKKGKEISLNSPKAPDLFLGFTKKSSYLFCIALICLDTASQWVVHLVLKCKDPQCQPLCHHLNCCPLLISWYSSLVKFTINELSYTGISLGKENTLVFV